MKLALSSCPEAGIVDGVFHQRLADALHGAAVHLAGEQQRIERGAEIVDHDVVQDRGRAGVGIDLDFRDMRAVRECRRLGTELVRRAQHSRASPSDARPDRRTRSRGRCRRPAPCRRRFPCRSRAASSASAASCLSCSASVLLRAVDRHAADRNRARAAGAGAGRDQIGVALHHAHALRRQIEPLGDQLRIGGGVALPGRLRADQHGDAAVALEPHMSPFPARCCRRPRYRSRCRCRAACRRAWTAAARLPKPSQSASSCARAMQPAKSPES